MTRVLLLTRDDVEALLDPTELLEAVSDAMRALSDGEPDMPPRTVARTPDGILASMTAWLPSAAVLSTKLVSVYPANGSRGLPSHHAVIVAFDPQTGAPAAILDGEAITAARTAAGSALATRHLARPDAETLTVVGTGVQALAHAVAVPRVMPSLNRILVAGRDPGRARALADHIAGHVAPGGGVHVSDGIEDGVGQADVVCACTHADEPVVRRDWLRDGTHVNSVGVNLDGREVDARTVADALLVVESRAAALGGTGAAGANDIAWPLRDGIIDEGHVHAEIGEIVAGRRPGRTNPAQITLYKSVGVAVQDAAAASLVLAAARERGRGSTAEL